MLIRYNQLPNSEKLKSWEIGEYIASEQNQEYLRRLGGPSLRETATTKETRQVDIF